MEQISRDDFRKKYDGTFFMVSQNGETIPKVFKHVDVGDNGEYLTIQAVEVTKTSGSGKITVFDSREIEILPPPESRLFEFKGEVFHYTKSGQRQWKVGYCHNNSNIRSPLEAHIRAALRHPLCEKGTQYKLVKELAQCGREEMYSSKVLYEIFSKRKPLVSLNDAIPLLGADKLSALLYETFWITLSPNADDEYFIFSLETMVAKVNDKTVTILNPKYHQEVLDYLKRSQSKGFIVN
jgi:hypothetical protein